MTPNEIEELLYRLVPEQADAGCWDTARRVALAVQQRVAREAAEVCDKMAESYIPVMGTRADGAMSGAENCADAIRDQFGLDDKAGG